MAGATNLDLPLVEKQGLKTFARVCAADKWKGPGEMPHHRAKQH